MAERKGIMLCYPFEERRLQTWRPPFITQPKLDGVRCRAVCCEGKWRLLSSSEETIVSVPHILRALRQSELHEVELDGELYVHGWPFERINSVVSRTSNLHHDFQAVSLHVFDVPSPEAQLTRMVKLHSLASMFPVQGLKLVPFRIAADRDEILTHFEDYCNEGYEGIIVRHLDACYERKRSRWVMKFKPKKSDYYTITGVNQMVDKNGVLRPAIGSFVCQGVDGAEFSVGSGMTEDFRYNNWLGWEKFVGKTIHIKYQSLNSETRNPRFPIFVEVLDFEVKEPSIFDV